MSPAASPNDPSRPSGKLRLAAALGGAGVLAVGFGGSVLQAEAGDGGMQTPTEKALGHALAGTTDQSTATSEPAPDAVVANASS
ncbi:MAG TPA: hypothetical protein VN238_16610, partial [Solirubrobacteraceae bacterium]|nr:hypothetical protein [Solirubrobacteraceae bacterium]